MSYKKNMSVMFVSVLSSMSVFAFPIASDVNLYGTYEMEGYCQDVTIMTEADTNKLENKVESDIVECLTLPNIQESFNGVAKRPSCEFLKGSKLNIANVGNNHILVCFQSENDTELKLEYKNSPGFFEYVKVKSASDSVNVSYQKYNNILGGLWKTRNYGNWIFTKTEKGVHVSYDYKDSTAGPRGDYNINSTGSCNLVKVD